MKLLKIFLSIFIIQPVLVCSQELNDEYRRSSLYSIMINHTDQKFSKEIREAFIKIPIPDKFNNHDLSVKVINLDQKLLGAKSNKENQYVTAFLNKNKVASRLVARWFNRDLATGICNMDLVKQRGLYDASEFDKQLAEHSARGEAMLQDAGEELIENTYVVVNDIRYIDKSEKSKTAGAIFSGLGSVLSSATGIDVTGVTDLVGGIVSTIKGFRVKINTFLYQLEWCDEQAAIFYKDQYADTHDRLKKLNFDNARDSYKLKYVGKVESSGSTTSFMGIKEDEPEVMVRKACQRAIDENIVDLQRNFESFRIKTPLVSVEPLTAYIGMKEGVDEKCKYEVLEVIEMEDGSHKYNRVGVIEPIKGQIWDNRYMAEEEGAPGATLGCTTFKKVKGKDFAKGMLIRELSRK